MPQNYYLLDTLVYGVKAREKTIEGAGGGGREFRGLSGWRGNLCFFFIQEIGTFLAKRVE